MCCLDKMDLDVTFVTESFDGKSKNLLKSSDGFFFASSGFGDVNVSDC